jgi:acyl carrier protein
MIFVLPIYGRMEEIMVLDKLKEILAAQFGLDEDSINENTDIAGDLGADSLDVVEMIMSLEDEFAVTISDEAVADLKTVGDVVRYIEGMLE